MLDLGKKAIDEYQLGQLRFDAEDYLKYVERIITDDPVTANFILTNKISALTEVFFNIRQIWIPAPKERLSKIQEISPEFYNLLKKFYKEEITLNDKLEIAQQMVSVVFKK